MKNSQMLLASAPSVQVSTMSSYIEISIDRDITAPEDFRDEIAAIRSAKEGDVVHIYLCTDGGRLDTANSIISAMRQSKAHIICEAVGTVASAGTIIFLAGDEFRVNSDVEYMCHTSSSGYASKTNNLAEYAAHQQRSIRKLVESSYKHFLTDAEIESMLSGSDFWMDSDEVCRRLQIRQEALDFKDAELTREDLESWPHERLVSFICDEDYTDEAWEESDTPVSDIDDIESTQDVVVLKSAADTLDIKYPHNIGIEKLREKILKFLEN